MEVVKTQTAFCQLVDIGCLDQAAKTADMGESDIVKQKDDDIRRTFRRTCFRRPPLFRVFVLFGNHAAKSFNRLCLFRRGKMRQREDHHRDK